VHAAAWKETFDDFLRKRAGATGEPFVRFDPVLDYRTYVDGMSRYDGVRRFLTSRRIELATEDVVALADAKNELVLQVLGTRGVRAYEGSLRYVRAARAAGLRTAVVSASANCREVLLAAGLDDLFDVRIDGVVAARKHLQGKPAPDTFLAAARALALPPAAAAVFEDALAGVAAGRRGGFGFVVGIDRLGQAEALRRHGADLVVADLAELLEET
jgi:HAD superfamily hydrolase (TIGR01509 family)